MEKWRNEVNGDRFLLYLLMVRWGMDLLMLDRLI